MIMNKMFVIANWKCNPTSFIEARRLFCAVSVRSRYAKGVEVIICPPFVYLLMFRVKRLAFSLGAQDCFWEEKGAYTGEVSPVMLKNLGCEYVIVGHSERRRYFRETDTMVNKKLKAAIKNGLKVILCVGETSEERSRRKTRGVLRRQLKEGLKDIGSSEVKNLVLAYEPVWAIGSGNPCNPEDAKRAAIFIREVLASLVGKRNSAAIPILYGGSVNSQNAADYVKKAGLQGLLIGGASLNAKEFAEILKKITLH